MCGIVGYVGDEDCANLLVEGLRKLEYRGYDSAGLAVLGEKGLAVVRAKGKLSNLEKRLGEQPPRGATGIGHTRWATHGKPSDENAHPHSYGGVAVVHNGIIENHLQLKESLAKSGHKFSSETDTEIFAHLIHDEVERGLGLPEAVRAALKNVRGTYALAVVSENHPGMLVVSKNASPLVVGIGDKCNFIASDVPAILAHTRDVIYLEEGDFAVITKNSVQLSDLAGQKLERSVRRIDWTPTMAEKNGHKHFMHKEIHEQARALTDTIRGRASIEEGDVFLDGCHLDKKLVERLSKIQIVACGTSWHASLTGKLMIETLARLPVEVDLASEFRYRDPLIDKNTLCIAVSQSGETADTLGSFREARTRGARGLAICNVVGSAIAREADDVLYTHAGPEIGVASTKAFTTQLAAFFLLAVRLGRLRGTISQEQGRAHLQALTEVPLLVERVLKYEEQIKQAAYKFSQSRDLLFLGRGPQYPVALEGALKLKEISYIHAEGYAAGEMKHGPIALIDENMPVMVLAPRDSATEPGVNYEKILGNIHEVRARGGRVIAIHSEGDEQVPRLAEAAIPVPQTNPLLMPMVSVVPTQLFSYHVADHRGTDVDQPRNLAKSVTVE
ncbi:MAG: glutamine--fructose-6-phosphate transaminase (isomerizing) [Deltaproteobacteria bacterium]|nr:MAG: glutamine--fructose-6-phosphate transaminase (isomerizing) [Deltaproteobacteria bacterium]